MDKLTKRDARKVLKVVDAGLVSGLGEPTPSENYISLPLRNRTKQIIGYALIDKQDAALAAFRWCLNTSGYVRRNYQRRGERQHEIRLSRVVTNAPVGMEVDHINGDLLDNRRSNLRVVTKAQNATNKTKPQKRGKITARGVFFHKGENKWCAQVRLCRKIVFYRRFKVYEDAVNAAQTARQQFGLLS